MKNKIKEQLIAARDEIFLEWQAKLHVVSGDVDPLVSLRFDKEINELAETMETILEAQPKLGIDYLGLFNGIEVTLKNVELSEEMVQKLAEVEKYLREKEII